MPQQRVHKHRPKVKKRVFLSAVLIFCSITCVLLAYYIPAFGAFVTSIVSGAIILLFVACIFAVLLFALNSISL